MLFGRDDERDRIGELLKAARSSRSSSLVLLGEPGVGKTALLQDTRDRAQDMHVLTAQGVESESELPFAALHQLFRSNLDHAEALPAPQAEALRTAMGLVDGATPERFLVSAACLSLLSELAERRPVLCIVDDAHWLDPASADALLFVARRLDAEGIVMLFGAREGDVRQFEAHDVASLVLEGLDRDSSALLLAHGVAGAVSPLVVDRLLDQTGGNALALLELPSALTQEQLAGEVALPEALPLTRQMESVFLERIRRLPASTQRLLLVAAADGTGDLRVIVAASGALGEGLDALDAAEHAGLLTAHGTRVEFRHPLVRSAVYGAATSAERRGVHAALAEALADDADRRAWHLAGAVVGVDEEVARLMDDVAGRAQERGAYASAARALERAAELSSHEHDRVRRLVGAARTASVAGQDDYAVALANRTQRDVSDPDQRADLAHVRALAQFRRGRPPEAISLLIAAAHELADENATKALDLLAQATSSALQSRDAEVQLEIAKLAATIVPPSEDERSAYFADLFAGVAAGLAGNMSEAAALFERAVAWGARSEDALDVFLASLAASWLGDDGLFEKLIERVISIARTRGEIGTLSEALSFRASQLSVGQRFDEAAVAADEALEFARELGAENYTAIPRNVLAMRAAVRGDVDEAEDGAKRVLELARTHRLPLRGGAALWILGVAEMVAGRWSEAVENFDAAANEDPLMANLIAADRIEAAVHAGQRDHAADVLAAFEQWATTTSASAVRPRLASCRAVLAAGKEATAYFEEALALSDAARPFDLARIRLAYGEHLRRERRRADARVHLRAALDAFEQIRAAPWADRARSELRASGEAARKRDPSTFDQLTHKEVQIARLVAEGMSNKEVAAQLFLSPRTIDYQLRNVFSKLGLTSRTQLARLQLGEPPVPEPAAV